MTADVPHTDLMGNTALSGAVLPWPLHPACSAWPEMALSDLRDLANDIEANGLRDPVTLTPDGQLLDGRNRTLAALIAGVDPVATAVVHHGDPWVFSLSRNKHRRHMTEAALALVAAMLATRPLGANQHEGAYKKAPSVKEAAAAAGIPKTAVEAAKVVLQSGTSEEIFSVRSGKKKLTPTANAIRDRNRGPVSSSPKSVKEPSSGDPIEVVANDIIAKCPFGKWLPISKIANTVKVAENAAKEALKNLGPELVETRPNGIAIEYRIDDPDRTRLNRLLAAKDAEIADLKARIAEQAAEIDRLMEQFTAPIAGVAPAPKAKSKAVKTQSDTGDVTLN
jgi:hypothetical protein